PAPAATALTLELAGSSISPSGAAVTLNLNTFRFGFHNSGPRSSSSGATGAASFDALDVTAALSAASPGLFEALTSGARYATAILTESNADRQPIAVWALGTVVVADDALTGSGGGLPTEELKFAFVAITEANSAGSASWSRLTNSDTNPSKLPAG